MRLSVVNAKPKRYAIMIMTERDQCVSWISFVVLHLLSSTPNFFTINSRV